MVASSTARWLRCCFAARGSRRAARQLGRLARSGPASLKERFALAGVFLEIFCRCAKITPNQGVLTPRHSALKTRVNALMAGRGIMGRPHHLTANAARSLSPVGRGLG